MRSQQHHALSCPAFRFVAVPALLTLLVAAFAPDAANARERQIRPVPPPPECKGVIVLFDGKPESLAGNWVKGNGTTPADWPVKAGAMTAKGDTIMTRERFTDFHLHLELMEPYMPNEKGQSRGNSGVFLQGHYEVQVLDSYGIADPGSGDCGAVYSQSAPLVNACKPPLMWQSFDYIYRAPRFDADGNRTEKARVTVIQNGIIVQNNTEINGTTYDEKIPDAKEPGPVALQFHGDPIQYRNIWIVPLPLKGASHY
jgi:hypothetical protein